MNGKMQNLSRLKITAFPRIHVSLIGMNSDGYRINGGLGFSIADPKIITYFKSSTKFNIIDEREYGFTEKEKSKLINRLKNLQNQYHFKKRIECHITGESLTHYGLGTTTAIYLSTMEAFFILNNKQYNESLIKSISTRGGTSGIGINTYFRGGGIFDVGILNTSEELLQPSSISTNRNNLPLVIKHIELPNWKVGVLLPDNLLSKSELEEINFFKRACPIAKSDVQEILYYVLYGTFSSLIENSFYDFCHSINRIQQTKWKKKERNLYGNYLIDSEKILFENGSECVGMSSLGPGLYFFSENMNKIQNSLKNKAMNFYVTELNNRPRIIEYD